MCSMQTSPDSSISIPHQVIMRGLTNVVADGNILRLVERFLTAGVMEDGVVRSTTLGTPQGGVLSPLLANIALNFLDWHLESLGYHFVRYADDFIVLCQTEHQAKEARQAVERFVQQLGIVAQPREDACDDIPRRVFLPGIRYHELLGQDACQIRGEIQARIRALTIRSHNLDADKSRNSTQSFAEWHATSGHLTRRVCINSAPWTAGIECG